MIVFVILDLEEKGILAMTLMNVQKVRIALLTLSVQTPLVRSTVFVIMGISRTALTVVHVTASILMNVLGVYHRALKMLSATM